MNCESCIKRKVCAFIVPCQALKDTVKDLQAITPSIFRVTPECLEYIQKPERIPYGCIATPADVKAAIAQANATMDHVINQAARR